MIDQGEGDEKILCVGEGNPRYNDVKNYTDVYPHILREIKHFFSIYKDLEEKIVEVNGWKDAEFAKAKIVAAAQRFIDNKAR
jgi:inorganic pyrophosphatase